jgi:hypothetical protein
MTRDKHPNTEASSTAQLWVRTLGGFVVRRDGVEIPADSGLCVGLGACSNTSSSRHGCGSRVKRH